MSVAFWSGVVAPGKPVTAEVPEGYVLNVQLATLEKADKADAPVTVRVKSTSIQNEPIDALRAKSVEQFNTSK
jgi:hypothetical protein